MEKHRLESAIMIGQLMGGYIIQFPNAEHNATVATPQAIRFATQAFFDQRHGGDIAMVIICFAVEKSSSFCRPGMV